MRVKTPPSYWKRQLDFQFQGKPIAERWAHQLSKIQVLRSISTVQDGSQWIHVSLSRTDRLPTYEEMVKVKNEFIGGGREAYQVFARDEDHVNVHSKCLHLWSPIDGIRRVANLQDLVNEEMP